MAGRANKRKIAVADSETDPFRHGRIPEPFIWGFYDGDQYLEWTDHDDFMQYVMARPLILYAHNGGRFDWHFILQYVPEWADIKIINGRIAQMKIGKCEFRDSFCILPVPLAQYMKTEIDYRIMEKGERYKPNNKKKISDYLKDDCVFLYNIVSEFVDEFGRGLTIAGTAMKQWEKISGRNAPDDDGTVFETIRPYYYGGRCQAFRYGVIDEPFEKADINSAYPYAMLSKHPISETFRRIEPKELAALSDDDLAVSFLDVECTSIGAFPMRADDYSLEFPHDDERRLYRVTGHEYIAGMETGALIDPVIKGGYVFDEFCTFEDYVNRFYELRKEAKANGDKARTLFYKLLMNSLYGKFAANPAEYHDYKTIPHYLLDKKGQIESEDGYTWQFAGLFGPHVLVSAPQLEEDQRYYNLATAASITGFVRAFMWRAIAKADGPIYCDTDSIAARSLGPLPYGTALGEWEHEGDFDFAAVGGKKLYAFRPVGAKRPKDWKIACKGVRLTPKQIIKVAEGGTVEYKPDAPVFSVHKEPTFVNRTVRATGAGAKKNSRKGIDAAKAPA